AEGVPLRLAPRTPRPGQGGRVVAVLLPVLDRRDTRGREPRGNAEGVGADAPAGPVERASVPRGGSCRGAGADGRPAAACGDPAPGGQHPSGGDGPAAEGSPNRALYQGQGRPPRSEWRGSRLCHETEAAGSGGAG